MNSQKHCPCVLALLNTILWRLILRLFLLLLLLFLACRDDQISEGVSDLFPGLLVGHDGVARSTPSSASAALLACLLLEESCTDLVVEHPYDRLDNICLVFPCRRVDIPLQVHLNGDSEPSVSDVVVGTTVASTDNVVWSRFGNYVAVVVRKVVVACHRIHVHGHGIHAEHVVIHVEDIEVVSVYNVGGSVDDGTR